VIAVLTDRLGHGPSTVDGFDEEIAVSLSDVSMTSLAGNVLAPRGSDLVLAGWTAAGAVGADPRYEAPLHRHEEAEAWYVLRGVLMVRVGQDDVEVPAGGAVVVPGGTAHTFWNPRAEPARYLLVMGARTHALIQALHASGDRGAEAVRSIFEAHGGQLLE
jgi:uncharacterized RmlC-like cupin family protein